MPAGTARLALGVLAAALAACSASSGDLGVYCRQADPSAAPAPGGALALPPWNGIVAFALDAEGSYLVAGIQHGTPPTDPHGTDACLEGDTVWSKFRAWVAKLDATRRPVWSCELGRMACRGFSPTELRTVPGGDVMVAGTTYGGAWSAQATAIRITAGGQPGWIFRAADAGDSGPATVAVGPAGAGAIVYAVPFGTNVRWLAPDGGVSAPWQMQDGSFWKVFARADGTVLLGGTDWLGSPVVRALGQAGSYLWEAHLEAGRTSYLRAMCVHGDGSATALSGYTTAEQQVRRVGSDGALGWARSAGGWDAIAATPDGGVVLLSDLGDAGLLVKLDAAGGEKWRRGTARVAGLPVSLLTVAPDGSIAILTTPPDGSVVPARFSLAGDPQ